MNFWAKKVCLEKVDYDSICFWCEQSLRSVCAYRFVVVWLPRAGTAAIVAMSSIYR